MGRSVALKRGCRVHNLDGAQDHDGIVFAFLFALFFIFPNKGVKLFLGRSRGGGCFPNESRFPTAFPNVDPRTGKGGLVAIASDQ